MPDRQMPIKMNMKIVTGSTQIVAFRAITSRVQEANVRIAVSMHKYSLTTTTMSFRSAVLTSIGDHRRCRLRGDRTSPLANSERARLMCNEEVMLIPSKLANGYPTPVQS